MCEETGPLAERGQSADAAPPLPPSPFNFVCLHFPPKQNHPEVIYFKARPPTDGAPQGGAGGGPLRAASTAPPPPRGRPGARSRMGLRDSRCGEAGPEAARHRINRDPLIS